MDDEAISELLQQLSSGRVDGAWNEFCERHSPMFRRVIRLHGVGHHHAEECLDYVCGALSDDGFRRLHRFRPDGPARFRTWLAAVVANLCMDWRRKESGRARAPRCVTRLPELDQQVYRCIYLQGMSRAQCVATLAPQFPELTDAVASEINARLFALLTPQQRWQLSARPHARNPAVGGDTPVDDDPAGQVAAPGPGPDDLAADAQQRRRLQEALAKLPSRQRLLLRLRYEQDLTLNEVARLTGQPDPFRANRQIQAALEALASLMGGGDLQPGRKTR